MQPYRVPLDPGSPPRVRSRLDDRGQVVDGVGITSACAEQTRSARERFRDGRDHLRVCGADPATCPSTSNNEGSPPRVRSRRSEAGAAQRSSGITSACAEQTVTVTAVPTARRDHLRVCGADITSIPSRIMGVGSPPRVRSRHQHGHGRRVPHGITSACAEQTGRGCRRGRGSWDHLRVCGADLQDDQALASFLQGEGSPPRVRSRHHRPRHQRARPGITSACAEQTSYMTGTCLGTRDHLRVCGADNADGAAGVVTLGSPPRVRSRRRPDHVGRGVGGITSACAEQTGSTGNDARTRWDHLRVCGADTPALTSAITRPGSPPRVRSRRSGRAGVWAERGITSACAEQTVDS